MRFLYDAIACGLLAALTWMGLVWMSPNRPIESGKAWVQGIGIVAIANIFVWIALVGLNLRLVPLWAFCFLAINAVIASFIFPLCEGIKIPNIWALFMHPLAITTIIVLLGGAVGFLLLSPFALKQMKTQKTDAALSAASVFWSECSSYFFLIISVKILEILA